jgi:hypothetical protein
MSTLTQKIVRASTGLVVAGVLVGGAAPAFAETPAAQSPATVAMSAPLDGDNGSPDFQRGLRTGTADGSRDGFDDARNNCQRPEAALHELQGFALSPFDEGYAQGYSIGYDKGFAQGEKRFCDKAVNEGVRGDR